jgi:hypothetical protein
MIAVRMRGDRSNDCSEDGRGHVWRQDLAEDTGWRIVMVIYADVWPPQQIKKAQQIYREGSNSAAGRITSFCNTFG